MKVLNKQNFFVVLIFLLSVIAVPVSSGDSEIQDDRINLGLTKSEKAEFLQEMRQMLVSIQGIISGIGEENRALIISSARKSGNRMARATPDSVRNKLPQTFKEIGGPTHMMFEEIAVIAETDDMDILATTTGILMQQCVACHSMFKVDE